MTWQTLERHDREHWLYMIRCVAGATTLALPLLGPATSTAAVSPVPLEPAQARSGGWLEATRAIVIRRSRFSTPWRQQLHVIKDSMQIAVADMARFLLVERPSVYQWLSGSQPRRRNQERINALEALARDWKALGLGSLRVYFQRSIPGTNRSLEAILMDDIHFISQLRGSIGRFADSAATTVPQTRSSVAERLRARGVRPLSERAYKKQRARYVRSTSSERE